MNVVMLCGRLGCPPKIYYTEQGVALTRLRICTVSFHRGHKLTVWHEAVVFGRDADSAHKYLVKGQLVSVRGMLVSRTYTTKNNERRAVTEVHIDQIEFLSRPYTAEPPMTRSQEEPTDVFEVSSSGPIIAGDWDDDDSFWEMMVAPLS